MGTKCFMVAKVNNRIAEERQCDRHHDADEPCNKNEVVNVSVFDVIRPDTSEVVASSVTHIGIGLPAGAMWFENYNEPNLPQHAQDWYHLNEEELARVRGQNSDLPARHPSFVFAEGPQLTVITPGGRWVIDSRASNCTMPFDYNHRCWIRHGEPPNITVDKVGGPTCAAGAGSIQCGDYHGFLQSGELT